VQFVVVTFYFTELLGGDVNFRGYFQRQDVLWYLTFRGPCLVIYSYNKTSEMH